MGSARVGDPSLCRDELWRGCVIINRQPQARMVAMLQASSQRMHAGVFNVGSLGGDVGVSLSVSCGRVWCWLVCCQRAAADGSCCTYVNVGSMGSGAPWRAR